MYSYAIKFQIIAWFVIHFSMLRFYLIFKELECSMIFWMFVLLSYFNLDYFYWFCFKHLILVFYPCFDIFIWFFFVLTFIFNFFYLFICNIHNRWQWCRCNLPAFNIQSPMAKQNCTKINFFDFICIFVCLFNLFYYILWYSSYEALQIRKA